MMTIEKLDELREAANKLLEEKRRVEGGFVLDPFIRDAARARYRVAVGAATDAVMEWVAQGCKAPPVLAGGSCCYCKVPFIVGEVRIDADGEGTPCHDKCYREPPKFRVNAPYPVPVLHNPDAEAAAKQANTPPTAASVLEAAWAEAARKESERADKAEAKLKEWGKWVPCSAHGCAMCICDHPDCTAYKSPRDRKPTAPPQIKTAHVPRNPPVTCAYCEQPIMEDETMIGDATGGCGGIFAHAVCYWRKQADLRQQETEKRVEEVKRYEQAFWNARLEEQAKNLQQAQTTVMERGNSIRDCIIAIRGLLMVVGPATENASCHADLVDRRECRRCSRIDYATKALARLPSSLLADALRVKP